VNKDELDRLIADMGPALDLLAIEGESNETFWRLAVDEDVLVYAELDAPRDALVLYAEIGAPPAQDRLGFYELAMKYHFAWDAFEGARLSLEEGRLWLIEEVATPRVTFDRLKTRLENFIRRFYQWRDLSRDFQPAGERDDPLSAFSDQHIMIKT
jgi:hypothetical protein